MTLVDPETATAHFPDAPTLRGQRHVNELVRAAENGDRAAVLFVVQRDDATRFQPYGGTDPAFGHALHQAAQAGVEVYAWRCHVSREAIRLVDPIPVML